MSGPSPEPDSKEEDGGKSRRLAEVLGCGATPHRGTCPVCQGKGRVPIYKQGQTEPIGEIICYVCGATGRAGYRIK